MKFKLIGGPRDGEVADSILGGNIEVGGTMVFAFPRSPGSTEYIGYEGPFPKGVDVEFRYVGVRIIR